MASSILSFSISPQPRFLFSPRPLSRPPHLLLPRPLPLPLPPNPDRRRPTSARAKNDPAGAADRLLSAACYLYPFLDGVQYGRHLFAQFPFFQLLLHPLLPAIRLFKSFPLNGFLVFLTLYFAVVRNPSSFSRFVRFNTMQAVALDVLLIFPDLLERSFNPREGVGLDLVMSADSTVFLFLLTCLVYGSASCLLGQVPRLPIVADAADRQVM